VEKALREREERVRLSFENANDGAVLVDPNGNMERVNNRMCDILGYSKEELERMTVNDIAHPEDKKIGTEFIEKSISGEIESAVLVKRYFHKQGHIIWGQVSSSIIKDAKENPICFISHVQDITQRKQAEEQIRASLKEKEILLREIHHRVKNNMQVIISLLRLQADKIEDKKYADMFKESWNRIKSMSLIHEKLYQTQNFANIDFGTHLKSLVDSLLVSYGVDTSKIRINMKIEAIPLDIENAVPCGLIVNELVSNSLKHAFPQEREGNVHIGLKAIIENEFELAVIDDGIGMPEDLDIEKSDSIGLTLVKMLAVHQLGGLIEMNLTEGTQFRIKFKILEYKQRV